MKAVLCSTVCLLLVVLSVTVGGAEAANLRTKLNAKQRSAAYHTLMQSRPRATFTEYAKTGVLPGEDLFEPLTELLSGSGAGERAFARLTEEQTESEGETETEGEEESEDLALVQTGAKVGKVQSFCEICILVMQMKERGQPHLCAGLNDQYYVTCVEVLISLLRADKALVYWLKNGCMHMDSTGPEIVRPCPAINICSWIPNLFSQPPSVVRDGVESLCPKDNKFLPTIPQEYKSLIPADKEK